MLNPAPQLFDGKDVVLHRLTVHLLILLLQLRPQPGHRQITRDLWRHKADLFLKLDLADYLAVAQLFNKILCEVLAVVGQQIIPLICGDEVFTCEYQYMNDSRILWGKTYLRPGFLHVFSLSRLHNSTSSMS